MAARRKVVPCESALISKLAIKSGEMPRLSAGRPPRSEQRHQQEDCMSRFRMLDRLLAHDDDFRDFFVGLTGGTSGHDHLNGTSSGNMLFAGGGDDAVAGKAGGDMLDGGSGNDKI